jgi:formamidopyrimidine-DNA glycosylase
MPESPEIRKFSKLIKHFEDTKLMNIHIIPDYKNEFGNIFNDLQKSFPIRIKKIISIGKKIFIIFYNDYFIKLSFGLSGSLSIIPRKDTSIIFICKKGNEIIKFYFNNVHYFNMLKTYMLKDLQIELKKLGYDPFYNINMSFQQFYYNYIIPNMSEKYICEVLLDQSIFAGIGNYLRAEILYATRINPFCNMNKLNKERFRSIFNAYKLLYNKSYHNKMTFHAYRRDDLKYVRKIKINKRILWYVPERIIYKC